MKSAVTNVLLAIIFSCHQSKPHQKNDADTEIFTDTMATEDKDELATSCSNEYEFKTDDFFDSLSKYWLPRIETPIVRIDSTYIIQGVRIRSNIFSYGSYLYLNGKSHNLNKMVTLNHLHEDGHGDSLIWSDIGLFQINYYKTKSGTFFCFQLGSYPCNGTGCNVSYYAIWKRNTQTINVFGQYSNRDLDLYDCNNDGYPDVFPSTHHGELIDFRPSRSYHYFESTPDGKYAYKKSYFDTIHELAY